MIKKISFYDFDGCLMNTPEPEDGKRIYKEKTGVDYPHKGWWGRKESLDMNIFDIKYNDSVYRRYLKDKSNNNVLTILLTNRMDKLSDEVINILSKFDINFDEYSFKSGNKEKVDRIKYFLSYYNDVDTIDIYDDRDKELVEFRKFRSYFGDRYDINIFPVKGGVIINEKLNRITNLIKEEIKNFFK